MARKRSERVSVGDLRSEAELQKALVEELDWRRFIALTTDRHRRACSECGHVDIRGDGVSEGLPDLFITQKDWPPLLWLGYELKRDEKSKIRPAQRVLADLDRVAIGWDHDEIMKEILRMDAAIRAGANEIRLDLLRQAVWERR